MRTRKLAACCVAHDRLYLTLQDKFRQFQLAKQLLFHGLGVGRKIQRFQGARFTQMGEETGVNAVAFLGILPVEYRIAFAVNCDVVAKAL